MLDHVLRYCYGTRIDLPFHDAVERTRQALLDEHFVVVSEIDMAATLRRGLGLETNPYLVMGVSNPTVLHYALGVEPDVGLIATCNVAVYADGATRSMVTALAPELMLSLTGNPSLTPLGTAMDVRLRRALETVERSARTRPTPVPIIPLDATGIVPPQVLADAAAPHAPSAAGTTGGIPARAIPVMPTAAAPVMPSADDVC